MATLTLHLPSQKSQTPLNMVRWAELLADPELAKIEGRIETDRHGHIIMSRLAPVRHGSLQSEISRLLGNILQTGRVFTECPISTADGVRAADVAWASPALIAALGNQVCFPQAPEICVEVLSPGNSKAEIEEKVALYFDAGAEEVWLCSQDGVMTFRGGINIPELDHSKLCAEFPKQVKLR